MATTARPGAQVRPVEPDAGWALKVGLLAAIAGVCLVGVVVMLAPIPQPPGYHAFADARTCLGIPNALNVASNLPFLLIGLAGFRRLRRWDAPIDPELHPAYMTFFVGLAAMALGSAYYHWAPDSGTLFWDRLPIAIAFMGLLSAVLGERIGPQIGRRLLLPLVAFGTASVVYWHVSDDLRIYAVAQFFPLLAMPMLLWLFPARFTCGSDLMLAIGCYGVAKVLEESDKAIYALGHIVSGHTLKHLAAGLGAWIVCRMLARRTAISA
jgi:hypothetical protein